MGFIKRKRLLQVIKFGWKDAKEISAFEGVKKSRITLFFDIISCFRNYYIFSNQYKSNKVWKLSKQEKIKLSETIGNQNRIKDKWIDVHYDDWKFLSKYTSLSWSKTPEKIKERNEAYRLHFGLGENIYVQYGVAIICEHSFVGKITCGKNVLLAKNVFLDYTGEVVISDNVKISAGVTIESHRHEFIPGAKRQKVVPTKIVIEDGVWIGQQAIICEDCKRIGRYAQIGAGAVVRNPIPPYAIVVGNPAKIVGFLFTPQEMQKFEENHFPDTPTDINQYEAVYNKLFINRINNIKQLLRN